MKCRVDFVTNSSSSSYVILGKDIAFSDIDKDLLLEQEFLALGNWLCDGRDIFRITPEIYDAIEQNGKGWSLNFVQVYYEAEEMTPIDASDLIDKIKYAGKITVWSGEVDYHTTETVEDFTRRYIDNENPW